MGLFEDLNDGAAVTIPETLLDFVLSRLAVGGNIYTEMKNFLREADEKRSNGREIENYEEALRKMQGYLQLLKINEAVTTPPMPAGGKIPLTKMEQVIDDIHSKF